MAVDSVYIGNGNATLTNVNITGNTANQGGGLFGTGPVSLKDCSIASNGAASDFETVQCLAGTGTVRILGLHTNTAAVIVLALFL